MGFRLLLGGLLCAGGGYLWLAWQIPLDPWTAAETVDSRTLPLLYGALLVTVLLFLAIRPVAAPRAAPALARLGQVGALCVLVLVFVMALSQVPLWIALGVLLAVAAWWLGERRWLPLAAVATGVPLAGWLAIEVALGVYLPS